MSHSQEFEKLSNFDQWLYVLAGMARTSIGILLIVMSTMSSSENALIMVGVAMVLFGQLDKRGWE
jgi:lipoprotein signal peptidase